MSEFPVLYLPVWVKLLLQACTEAEENLGAPPGWPPIVERAFWQETTLETAIIVAALFTSIGALIIWWRRSLPIQSLKILGLQIVILCATIGLIINLSHQTDLMLYSSLFFIWLGNLGFFAAAAICIAILAGLFTKISNNRPLQALAYSGNILVTGIMFAGWISLVYAKDFCAL